VKPEHFVDSVQTRFSFGRITIRPFCAEDAVGLHSAALESTNELSDWMVWFRPDYSIEHSRAFLNKSAADWKRGERYTFAIVDSVEGTFLGSVGLFLVSKEHRFANIGYWVRTGKSGHGIGSAATLLAAIFGFNVLGLNRIEFVVPPGNRASLRVAEKVGAKREGSLRRRIMLGGKAQDAVLYSLIVEDLASESVRPPS
jgi:ribosomal-protein-serine acetyltransferase